MAAYFKELEGLESIVCEAFIIDFIVHDKLVCFHHIGASWVCLRLETREIAPTIHIETVMGFQADFQGASIQPPEWSSKYQFYPGTLQGPFEYSFGSLALKINLRCTPPEKLSKLTLWRAGATGCHV